MAYKAHVTSGGPCPECGQPTVLVAGQYVCVHSHEPGQDKEIDHRGGSGVGRLIVAAIIIVIAAAILVL